MVYRFPRVLSGDLAGRCGLAGRVYGQRRKKTALLHQRRTDLLIRRQSAPSGNRSASHVTLREGGRSENGKAKIGKGRPGGAGDRDGDLADLRCERTGSRGKRPRRRRSCAGEGGELLRFF